MPRLSVSQIELLQLHLMEMEPFRKEMEVPLEACQEGISGRMDSGLHNISRALATMAAEGLVESRLCHVRGASKRRKAYFLTEKGLQSAHSLVSDLESRIVSLDDGRSIRNVTLGFAIRCSAERSGKKPNLRDFVKAARNVDNLVLEAPTGSPREPEVMFFGRPEVEVFEGREAEFGDMKEFLSSEASCCALVVGLPGIGKSTLASKVFEDLMKHRSAFWYTVHEWDSVQSIARALMDFLRNSGTNIVFADIELESELANLYSPVVLGFREIKPAIFFDDVDRAAPGVSLFLNLLCDAVKAAPGSKIVLVSRSVPSFLGSAVDVRRVDLKCMDSKASSLLASKWHAPDPIRTAEESGGHPLMLRLSCEIGTEAARGSIDDILGEHFQRTLNAQEKDLLEFLSVLRLPVPATELPGFLPETALSLRRKGLVQEFTEGLAVHQVVRSYFISKIPEEDIVLVHRKAAAYCGGRSGERWRLEEISQHIAAGDWAKAAETILENSEWLIDALPEESLALISDIPIEGLEPRSAACLSYLRGRAVRTLGGPREALVHFERSLSLLGNGEEEALRASVLEAYAGSLAESNRIEESLKTHRQALSYYQDVNDPAGQIREWMGIGSTWRRAHETKEAGKAFRTALGIAREHKDMAAVAANLNNVALLEWDSGDLKAAEAGLKESVSVAKAAGDDMGEGIGQTNLADLYLIQLRERESENLRLESAETFRRAGDLLQFKRIKARWAIDISRVGRSREALDALERLIGVSGRSIRTNRRARSIDEGDLSLLLALIEVYRDSGDRGRTANAIGSLLHIARDTERRDLEAQAWMESALTDEAFGDMVVALHDLKQAENLLREMGNSEGLGAVYVRSGTIRLQSGLRDEALVDLREAVRHAELSGSVASHAAALGELGEALGSVSAEGRECLEMSRQLRKAGRVKAHDRS